MKPHDFRRALNSAKAAALDADEAQYAYRPPGSYAIVLHGLESDDKSTLDAWAQASGMRLADEATPTLLLGVAVAYHFAVAFERGLRGEGLKAQVLA
jgi:hypothetical protein